MAGRPRKQLADHVRDGSFLARRHGGLLAGDPLPWPGFAELQHRYQAAGGDAERVAVAREFERLVRHAHDQAADDVHGQPGPGEVLASLDGDGDASRVAALALRWGRHYAGTRAGEPFSLEAWERWVLDEFLARDERGRRLFIWLLLGVPKGNGKTPLAALLGWDGLLTRPDSPEVYNVAGSKLQAGICTDYATRWRDDSDELADWTRVRSRVGALEIRCPANRGLWRVLSADGRLGHGLKPSRAILDEWHVLSSRREEEAYVALASALHKREDADFVGITTAGYDLGSQLGVEYAGMLKAPELEVRADGCLTVARDRDARKLMIWYGAPAGLELEQEAIMAGEHDELLRACNPLSVLDLDQLRRQFALLPFPDAERLILNRWTKARDSWLPAGVWARLRADAPIPAGADVYVAVDAALKYDTTACAWAHRLEDGRVLVQARVWSAREDAPHHVYVPGGRIRNELVEEYITDVLATEYHVVECAYDPRYFDTQGARLADAGLVVAEFPQQSAAMADAYQHFYEAATAGTVCHDGCPVFAQHVEAAAATPTPSGWKVYKLRSHAPIDALVAAVMARERCQVAARTPEWRWGPA